MMAFDAVDCASGEPVTSGADYITVAVHPRPDRRSSEDGYEASLSGYGDPDGRFDTHYASLSEPWNSGEVFVSENLAREPGTGGAAAIALEDAYFVEVNVELKSTNCPSTMEDAATILEDSFMSALHDSIETRLSA